MTNLMTPKVNLRERQIALEQESFVLGEVRYHDREDAEADTARLAAEHRPTHL